MMRFSLVFYFFLGFLFANGQDVTVADFEQDIEQDIESTLVDAKIDEMIEQTNPKPNEPARSNKQMLKQLKKADEAFTNFWYAEAAKRYDEALLLSKDLPAIQTLQKVADSYYYIGDMDNASKWYDVLFENYEDVLSQDDLFKYSHALKGVKRKENADRILGLISQRDFPDESTMPSFLKENEFVLLKNLDVNTKYSDFGPIRRVKGKMVFASASDSTNGINFRWNDQPFLDLYEATLQDDSYELKLAKKLNKKVNTRRHEATATFSLDGKTMYFTRNGQKKKKVKIKKDGVKEIKEINNLKIYISKLKDNEWSKPKEIAFGNKNYSYGHPALSPDGKRIYFVSDMPGGYGDTDIYVVDVYDDNSFSEPKNLGSEINSDKREMFPYVTENTIYFSSDRDLGLGGLDIYKSSLIDSIAKTPINLGEPLNSIRDDFSFSINEEDGKGYLSSNREGGKGDDDIYYFEIPMTEKAPKNNNEIYGAVLDSITNVPIMNADITLYDLNNLKIAEVSTDENGFFRLENLISNHDYKLNVKKDGYEELIDNIATEDNVLIQSIKKLNPLDPSDIDDRIQFAGTAVDDLTGEPIANANITLYDANNIKIASVSTDENGDFVLENLHADQDYILGVQKDGYEDFNTIFNAQDDALIKLTKKLNPNDQSNFLENDAQDTIKIVKNHKNEPMFKTEAIYFNFDSSTIRSDAKSELNELADFLIKNQHIKIKIESHTDSRGSHTYNKHLSEQRASASKDYLISQGVSEFQILSAIGYGEAQLQNNCFDGTPCTEQAHQLNRRSEFVFVKD